MSVRIDARFAQLAAENRAGFVAYVMAGDPDAATALEILRGLPGAGADLIELGFPFSDPMAEGPTIQLASQRALKARMTLRGTLELVRQFRSGAPFPLDGGRVGDGGGAGSGLIPTDPKPLGNGDQPAEDATPIPGPSPVQGIGGSRREPVFVRHDEPLLTAHRPQPDTDTPVILMGYLNPLLSYGYARFAADAAEAGVDGLIVVDCPPEEAGPLAYALDAEGMALIRLATPTSDDARLAVVTARTSGFVYYVSVAGVTGVGEANAAAVAPAVARVRAASGLPVAVGFGIRTPERAAEVARVADAVVVGSALVDEIKGALDGGEGVAPRVLGTARTLADAVRGARSARGAA